MLSATLITANVSVCVLHRFPQLHGAIVLILVLLKSKRSAWFARLPENHTVKSEALEKPGG